MAVPVAFAAAAKLGLKLVAKKAAEKVIEQVKERGIEGCADMAMSLVKGRGRDAANKATDAKDDRMQGASSIGEQLPDSSQTMASVAFSKGAFLVGDKEIEKVSGVLGKALHNQSSWDNLQVTAPLIGAKIGPHIGRLIEANPVANLTGNHMNALLDRMRCVTIVDSMLNKDDQEKASSTAFNAGMGQVIATDNPDYMHTPDPERKAQAEADLRMSLGKQS
ncbi:hypothetical protein [Aliagarivorans taiwanensis]|uniref:hypothetical protein n=1 Tax=Aliagarivorans taiwanensis TaxID=561966 RepID=UPI0012FCD841|nr:hypothetical protein [Aliagarivorans taiwanensis]